MELIEKIANILFDGISYTSDSHLQINKISNTEYEIVFGMMYDKPEINFPKLIELANIFGTNDINVNNYDVMGCETCDWGSDYGYELQIKNVTKNIEELEKIIGMNFNEKGQKSVRR